MTLRTTAKALVETVIGRDIRSIEPGTVAFIDRRNRHHAWFSYDLQLQWLLETNNVDLVVDVGANEGQLRSAFDGSTPAREPSHPTRVRTWRRISPTIRKVSVKEGGI